MSKRPRKTKDRGDGGLRPAISSVRDDGENLNIVVEVENPMDRTIHYIADVRAIDYDPGTRSLKLRLTDQGIEMPPGSIAVLPKFRSVEPNGHASFTLTVPRSIVRLAPADGPPSPLPKFEEQPIAQSSRVEVEIGWSDTPFYPDPREPFRGKGLLGDWESGQGRAALSLNEPKSD